MLKYTIIFAMVAGLVFALAPAAQADIVTVSNPSFQDPATTNYVTIENQNNSTSLPGWTLSQAGGKISLEGRSRGADRELAYNGDQYPNIMNGTTILSQNIGTVGDITGAGKELLTLNWTFANSG